MIPNMATSKQSWKPGTPVRIAGLGVALRSLGPTDMDDAFLAQLRSPAVARFLTLGRNPATLAREELLQMLKVFDNRGNFLFGISGEGDPRRLGFCWVRSDVSGVASLTLAIPDADLHRRGLAAAASYVLRCFLFDVVRIPKLAARVYADNAPVIQGMKKYGWVLEGRLRQAVPDGKGGRRDILLYAMLRQDHLRGAKPKVFAAELK
jgi:RimJ/RimL family protein N-acetyltransferase